MSRKTHAESTHQLTELIVGVLMRRLFEDKLDNGEEKTGIPPERMDQHTAP